MLTQVQLDINWSRLVLASGCKYFLEFFSVHVGVLLRPAKPGHTAAEETKMKKPHMPCIVTTGPIKFIVS